MRSVARIRPHEPFPSLIPSKHYSFNGQHIATRKGGTLHYVHADHLNSSSMETSASGAQAASRTYYAYGSTRASSGSLQTDRTFTGQKSDGTGLLYYNARYYDPALGVVLSPDSLSPASTTTKAMWRGWRRVWRE